MGVIRAHELQLNYQLERRELVWHPTRPVRVLRPARRLVPFFPDGRVRAEHITQRARPVNAGRLRILPVRHRRLHQHKRLERLERLEWHRSGENRAIGRPDRTHISLLPWLPSSSRARHRRPQLDDQRLQLHPGGGGLWLRQYNLIRLGTGAGRRLGYRSRRSRLLRRLDGRQRSAIGSGHPDGVIRVLEQGPFERLPIPVVLPRSTGRRPRGRGTIRHSERCRAQLPGNSRSRHQLWQRNLRCFRGGVGGDLLGLVIP